MVFDLFPINNLPKLKSKTAKYPNHNESGDYFYLDRSQVGRQSDG